MKSIVFGAIIAAISTGCHQRNESNFVHSFQLLNKKLYIENYSAGLIGNLTSQYITDSTNFRMCLGTFDDEKEFIYVRNSGDSLIVEEKLNDLEAESRGVSTLKERKTFSLDSLKKGHDIN